MDTYADELATLIETLDMSEATLIGFFTGGGEVARYIGRHGTARVAKAALISAVPPLMLKTENNPDGLPIEVFDGLRAGTLADRSQLYQDLASGPFFGFNRPGANVSQGMIDWFCFQGMQAGHKNAFDCIKAFSQTDFIGAAPIVAAKLVKNVTLKIYPGAPHGLTDTHKEQLNNDLLSFLKD